MLAEGSEISDPEPLSFNVASSAEIVLFHNFISADVAFRASSTVCSSLVVISIRNILALCLRRVANFLKYSGSSLFLVDLRRVQG